MLDHYTTGLITEIGGAPPFGVRSRGSLWYFNYLFGLVCWSESCHSLSCMTTIAFQMIN